MLPHHVLLLNQGVRRRQVAGCCTYRRLNMTLVGTACHLFGAGWLQTVAKRSCPQICPTSHYSSLKKSSASRGRKDGFQAEAGGVGQWFACEGTFIDNQATRLGNS